ncbi:MAG TPA: hypothetical protein VFF78_08205 [Anaerolineaceae bacterium]|nr:hypothetical protein [Anaerolineaceae bacterium]
MLPKNVLPKKVLLILLLVCLSLLTACAQATPTISQTSPTQAPDISPTSAPPKPTAQSATPGVAQTAMPISNLYPPLNNAIPAGVLPQAGPLGNYVVFAWNNLGMHCFQLDYSVFLILPPYNIFWAQVISRGDEPRIVNSGVTVSYSMPQVTQPTQYTNFWDYAAAYGWNLQPGIGLTGKGTSGTLDAQGDAFVAAGVPVVDHNDDGTWDPYPFFLVNVKNGSGQTVAETVNVAPASTEMRCDLCHAGNTYQEVLQNILLTHDQSMGTELLKQSQSGKPVACNTCHSDAAMGVMTNNGATQSLSGAMHTFHADKMQAGNLPGNICQSCHPGPSTQCLRDAMSEAGITCQDCHGGMADVGDPNRTPWVNLPQCTSCHTSQLSKTNTKHIDNPNQNLTSSASALYQNSKAHGGGGIYCAACHGSPHAIYPTVTERDNQQSIRLQGHAGPIAECSVCHTENPDESFWHFGGDD